MRAYTNFFMLDNLRNICMIQRLYKEMNDTSSFTKTNNDICDKLFQSQDENHTFYSTYTEQENAPDNLLELQ